MPPQTRKLLVMPKDWVKGNAERQSLKPEELRFTRRDVRAALNWGDTQLKIHLALLLEMEYLLLFRRGLTYEYGLLWDGQNDETTHLCGLLDVGNETRSGSEAAWSASGRGAVGLQSGSEKMASSQALQGLVAEPVGSESDAVIREKKKAVIAAAPEQVVNHG